jgi:hypothetical protein
MTPYARSYQPGASELGVHPVDGVTGLLDHMQRPTFTQRLGSALRSFL